MSRHVCKSDPCLRCEDRIDAEIERREGRPRGYSDRTLGDMADAQAANDWANRGGE